MKSVINIRVDKQLKDKAQKVAKDLGVPLGTVIKNYLNEFVEDEMVIFTKHPMPNARTRKRLDAATADIKARRNLSPRFSSAKEAIDSLDK